MKITVIGTYPPRRCGIATFTNNLVKNLHPQTLDPLENCADIVAISRDIPEEKYPTEVKFIIHQHDQQDYYKAADFINFSESRICILEHEFGIFGGDCGAHILHLVHRLQVPLIVTLHTVLRNPSFLEKSILQEIGKTASKLVVMSQMGVQFLKEVYLVPENKIELIEHGVPHFDKRNSLSMKRKFHFEKKKVILTFGLLGRNKGIETVIHALPEVVKKYPEVVYVVLGKTHPNVLLESGDQYRQYLKLLVREKKIENHVIFIDQFVPENTLLHYLASTDIYVTPYLNEAQSTSGTLAYAVGAGATCVSTPYWHAKELLDEGRGVLFDFKDDEQLSNILIALLDDPASLQQISKKAYEYGKKIRWNRIGGRYFELACDVARQHNQVNSVSHRSITSSHIPGLNLTHFKRLTDDTGIIQHAKYGIPNLKEGYCLDDNARALITATAIYRKTKSSEALDLIPVFFSYIHYMQNIKGTFRNFLSFDRKFLDEEGSEDSFGRAVWALGYLIRFSPNDAYHQLASEIFSKALPNFDNISSIRGIANTVIGITHYLHRFGSDETMILLMQKLRDKLVNQYLMHRKHNWHWFEDIMAYDNAVLPLALYYSHEIVESPKVLEVAEESFKFLDKVTMKDDCFSPVGSDGWYPKNGTCAKFSQQATDTMLMTLLYYNVFRHNKRSKYLQRMHQCFAWFLGENDLRIPLYDHETYGCCDGLESYGVNRNQGAESTLAYLFARMCILDSQDSELQLAEKKKTAIGNSSKTRSRNYRGPAFGKIEKIQN